MEESQLHIPEGWEGRELGTLYLEKRKSKFKVSDATNYGGIPFYTSGDAVLEHNEIQTDGENIFLATGGVANVKFYNGKVAYSTDTYVIVGKENIDTQFLYFKILDQLYYINTNFFQGSGLKHLQKKDFRKHFFALPKTKTEQQSIANILSKIDQAIANTEALIAKYTRIKTGLMQDLLTKGIDEKGNIRSEQTHEFKDSPLGRIPKEWECEIIDNIYDLRSGITPLRSNKKYFSDEGYNWVKTLDLNEEYLYSTEEKISQFALDSISIQLMPINSILIAMYGGWEQIGRTSIIKKEAATNQAITCLFNPKKVMNADYVQLVLQQYRYKWKQYAVSTRKDPNITKTDIKNFILAFPIDVKEQDKIVDRIMKTKDFISKSKTELTKLQSLKTGLMQDLLSGKVRVNNVIPGDNLSPHKTKPLQIVTSSKQQ